MRERVSLALVHHPTLGKDGSEITTAVTSLDLHDFARLATTYGFGAVSIVTNLETQVALVERLIEHWVSGHGAKANPDRKRALGAVKLVESLGRAVAEAKDSWGAEPIVVGTTARAEAGQIGFGEMGRILAETERPVIVVFGTGWGLAQSVMEMCDYVVQPVDGGSGYNHLSVRSAASIVVDRLFGR